MLKEERQQLILDTLRREGKVLTSELGALLGASEDTIRRDLRDLADEGRLQRVHGGALPRSPAGVPYPARQQQAAAAKAAIAMAAARLVRNGQVVILDGGTTTLQVAQCLPHDLEATIITHSPPVALALSAHPRIEVVIIGGRLFKQELVAVGAATVAALSLIRADLCMIGVCSLHPDIGISVTDFEEAQVKRIMIANAAEVVALASTEKLGTAAPYVVAPIRELTHLVTDPGAPEALLQPYRDCGITVLQG